MRPLFFLASGLALLLAGRPCRALPGLGVNIHTTAPQPGETGLIRSTGFTTVRMDLHWHDTETRPGHYDFTPYDRLTAALEASGIRPLLILNYGHPFYDEGEAPASSQARAAFARWAAAAVARYKDRGILWEIYNEPNLSHFWKPQPDAAAYVALVRETANAIRAVAPGETLLGPASSGVDLNFLEACFRLGVLEHLDAITVHPYRGNEPESVIGDYRNLRSLIARYAPAGREIPILCGEWGYSAAWAGHNERRQALMLTRLFLANVAAGIPLTIWYDWRNDGDSPSEPEHNFGLLTRSGAPKMAWQAASALARELDGFEFHMRLQSGRDDEFVLLFRSGTAAKLAVWTTASRTRSIGLPLTQGQFRVVHWTGAEQGLLTAGASGLNLELTQEPVFLEPVGVNPALEQAAMWDALPQTVRVHAPADLELRTNFAVRRIQVLRNEGRRPIEVALPLDDGREWRQSAWLEVDNPLELTLTPGAVQLTKPEGEILSAQLSADLEQGVYEAALSIISSEPSHWMILPAPQSRVGAVVRDLAGVILAKARETRFSSAGSVAQSHILLDGDPSVPGSAEVGAACPPDAPADGCAEIRLQMGAGPRFLRLAPGTSPRPQIPAGATALGAWVRGDASGAYLRLRFTDSTGQTFQPAGIGVTWHGWRWVEIATAGDDARLASWGGANDGQVHGSLTVDTQLLIDKPGPEPLAATLAVASMVWISR